METNDVLLISAWSVHCQKNGHTKLNTLTISSEDSGTSKCMFNSINDHITMKINVTFCSEY